MVYVSSWRSIHLDGTLAQYQCTRSVEYLGKQGRLRLRRPEDTCDDYDLSQTNEAQSYT